LTDTDGQLIGPDRGLPLRISEVRLRLPPDPSGPVVAYASCLINGSLALNDIRIERGRQGGLVIVYPSKPSSTGKRHSTFNPVTREASETIRQALLGGLSSLLGSTRTPIGQEEGEQ
jgi:DNA-binding cell septation regulator SpoVG